MPCYEVQCPLAVPNTVKVLLHSVFTSPNTVKVLCHSDIYVCLLQSH